MYNVKCDVEWNLGECFWLIVKVNRIKFEFLNGILSDGKWCFGKYNLAQRKGSSGHR